MIQTSAVTLEVGRAGCSAHRPASRHRGHPSHSGSGGDPFWELDLWGVWDVVHVKREEETLLSLVFLKWDTSRCISPWFSFAVV